MSAARLGASGSTIVFAGIAVASMIAGLALPRLIRSGRVAAKSLGGMTFKSGIPDGRPSNADPARARPA